MISKKDLFLKYPNVFNHEIECEDGWLNIIDEATNFLFRNKTNPENVEAKQVKEKFGTLRYYHNAHISSKDCEIFEMILSKSAHTCEKCGAAGKIRAGGWIKTLCEIHKM